MVTGPVDNLTTMGKIVQVFGVMADIITGTTATVQAILRISVNGNRKLVINIVCCFS